MADRPHRGDVEHELANQLGLISGYCNLLLEETPDTDPRRADLLEIHAAATAALQLFQRLNKQSRVS